MAAGIQIHDGTADRTINEWHIIGPDGVDRTIIEGRIIGPDGHDRVFWDTAGTASFVATASPTGVHGSSSTGTILTNGTTVTPTGGTAPYSYAWAVLSHTNGTAPTINFPTAAATGVTQTNMAAGDFDSATIRCTVTDSATPANVTTVDVGCIFHDTSTL